MKLVDYTVENFVQVLGSDAPAPGGGSASSLAGSLGAALCSMVCALSMGKKKYEPYQELVIETKKASDGLMNRFLQLIDEDTQAYNEVSAVFSMPKETDSQKEARKKALQEGLKKSTQPPLEMMKTAKEALEWTKGVLEKSNENAASDLGVAALCLKTALQGAWLNVLINVGSIEDESFNKKYIEEGEALLDASTQLADEIYEHILQGVRGE